MCGCRCEKSNAKTDVIRNLFYKQRVGVVYLEADSAFLRLGGSGRAWLGFEGL